MHNPCFYGLTRPTPCPGLDIFGECRVYGYRGVKHTNRARFCAYQDVRSLKAGPAAHKRVGQQKQKKQ